mmetsp:Transcript_37753/g.121368  ORF Transcript_37753/g.121368 Transcript_37753/m.121368 type:complete len:254 (-) Transcript_37753:989-1750(-)|eukprot:scaffold20739_cov105-Isochrysis_galbana.AAC.2
MNGAGGGLAQATFFFFLLEFGCGHSSGSTPSHRKKILVRRVRRATFLELSRNFRGVSSQPPDPLHGLCPGGSSIGLALRTGRGTASWLSEVLVSLPCAFVLPSPLARLSAHTPTLARLSRNAMTSIENRRGWRHASAHAHSRMRRIAHRIPSWQLHLRRLAGGDGVQAAEARRGDRPSGGAMGTGGREVRRRGESTGEARTGVLRAGAARAGEPRSVAAASRTGDRTGDPLCRRGASCDEAVGGTSWVWCGGW